MSFSDEILMAYADGELGEPERSLVERAVRDDAQVAATVERHRALRADVAGAFAGILDEPVPARLGVGAGARVASLDAARAARAQAAAPAPSAVGARPPAGAWWRWGGMAASLVLGIVLASAWPGRGDSLVVADSDGALQARGALARALTHQPAASSDGPVQIGLSFAARDGGYCRSFTVGGTAGLACREGDAWRIPVLKESPSQTTSYRQANSALPGAVLEAIDERIAGETLDAAAERAALAQGWRPANVRR